MSLPVSLALYVISTLGLMTSAAEPRLSLKVTTDVTFTCTMAGFDGKMARLLSLQIVAEPFCDLFGDAVLASVDYEGARTTLHLGGFRHVAGKLYLRRERDSWLKLTVHDFDYNRGTICTAYTCKINYLEHLADPQHSSWQETVHFGFPAEPVPTVQLPGFSVSVTRSLHAVCEYQRLVSYSALVKEDGTVLASSSDDDDDDDDDDASLSRQSYHVVTRFERYGSVLEAYLPRVNCQESWRCHCAVRSSSGGLLTSSSRTAPGDHCPQPPEAGQDGGNALNTARAAPPVKHFTIGILASVFVVVLIVAVIGLVILRLRKRRRACFKARGAPGGDVTDSEAKESLSGDRAAKGDTKDVDVRKSPEEESVSLSEHSDRVSVASFMGLHVRPDTSDV